MADVETEAVAVDTEFKLDVSDVGLISLEGVDVSDPLAVVVDFDFAELVGIVLEVEGDLELNILGASIKQMRI